MSDSGLPPFSRDILKKLYLQNRDTLYTHYTVQKQVLYKMGQMIMHQYQNQTGCFQSKKTKKLRKKARVPTEFNLKTEMSDMNLCNINCSWHTFALMEEREPQEEGSSSCGRQLGERRHPISVQILFCISGYFRQPEGSQNYPIFPEKRAYRGLPDFPHILSSSSAGREEVSQMSQLLSTCLHPQLCERH